MRVYTDGSCRSGTGGWAWWNEHTNQSCSGVETESTNQRMELKAALEAINEFFTDPELVIISDSAYLVNCFGEKWWAKWVQNGWIGNKGNEIVNRDIWEPLLEIVQEHGAVKFEWVKGHSGVPGNEKVDKLASAAVIKHQKGKFKDGRSKARKAARADQENGSNQAGEGTGIPAGD